jgi:pimeloyl-ACP methyl ester carboxylesterase
MTYPGFPEPRFVTRGDIRLAVYEQGQGPAVLMLHGYPELAFSWRAQMPALAAAGFRAIAMDQRGYGSSSVPRDVSAYTIDELVADVVAVLDALAIDQVLLVGHDWGGSVAWETASAHGNRLVGIASLGTTRLIAHHMADPSATLVRLLGPGNYISTVQREGSEELWQGRVRERFAGLFRRPKLTRAEAIAQVPGFDRVDFESLFAMPMGEPFITSGELEVFGQTFDRTGFFGANSWYRNLDRNAALLDGRSRQVDVPALLVIGSHDYFFRPGADTGMEAMVPHLSRVTIDSGHWMPQEAPEAVSQALVAFCRRCVDPIA